MHVAVMATCMLYACYMVESKKRLTFCICNYGVITVGTRKKHVIMNRNNRVIASVNIIRLRIHYDT